MTKALPRTLPRRPQVTLAFRPPMCRSIIARPNKPEKRPNRQQWLRRGPSIYCGLVTRTRFSSNGVVSHGVRTAFFAIPEGTLHRGPHESYSSHRQYNFDRGTGVRKGTSLAPPLDENIPAEITGKPLPPSIHPFNDGLCRALTRAANRNNDARSASFLTASPRRGFTTARGGGKRHSTRTYVRPHSPAFPPVVRRNLSSHFASSSTAQPLDCSFRRMR